MSNYKNGTLYIGVTNNLYRRIYEHKFEEGSTFTNKYKLNRLVYYEGFDDVVEAIAYEKQLKRWLRKYKIELINKYNPYWLDLSQDWYNDGSSNQVGG